MSAATRAKLAAAARARWVQRKGTAPAKAPAKKKGGLTAAGRKKLSDAMKARWAMRPARSGSGDGGPKKSGSGDGGPKKYGRRG
jgi:hypothetical protein